MSSYFVFDLDGTLSDTVYQHVAAWTQAFDKHGISVSPWRIHRRIGMGGSELVKETARERDSGLWPERIKQIEESHGAIFRTLCPAPRSLPGAKEIVQQLRDDGVAWAIATSGRMEDVRSALASLGVSQRDAVIITSDEVKRAKPDPDLFLRAAQRLERPIEEALVVGDSVWDMIAARRASAAGIGLLSGGNAAGDLREAGASWVFEDPADLLLHLGEVLDDR